jgi:hypothetical protein
MARPPLSGVRLHLSGSVPEDATNDQATAIRLFVERLAREIFREGGTVLHGSHPSLIEPLKAAAIPFVSAGGAKDALTLVRARKYAETAEQLSEIEEQRNYAAVHIVPSVPGNVNEALVPMREWMADRCDVIVAIGGKWYKVDKSRAGVPAELEETLIRGKPGFIAAAFGGAVQEYIKDDASVLSRLRNGLSDEANRAVAGNANTDELVNAIVSQIKLLPLVRETISRGRLFRILALDGGGLRCSFD